MKRKDMEAAVSMLFRDYIFNGKECDRLVQESKYKTFDAPGWCKKAVVDMLCHELGIGDKDQ